MYTCANCTVLACANNEPEKMPKNCPMRNASVMEAARRSGYVRARVDGNMYERTEEIKLEKISTSTVRPLRGLATVNGPA